LASYPALDVLFDSGPGAGALRDLLYAELDDFEPVAVQDLESGDGWRVFFRTTDRRDAARSSLVSSLGGHVLDLIPVEVDDEDWARRSQADLRSVRIGDIVIAPPWDAPPDPGAIIINPSTGFGTGHHATTRLCVELLQAIDVRGRRVLDIGTGSGVLAIVAARLGAAGVVAVDNDPDAIRNAHENVRRNHVESLLDVRLADLADVVDRADVLLANLTGALLAGQADRLDSLAAPAASAILSGFGPEDSHGIASAWTGWSVRDRRRDGDWAAVVLEKHS
jgi:ribosomal protein L11 methyltransferase